MLKAIKARERLIIKHTSLKTIKFISNQTFNKNLLE